MAKKSKGPKGILRPKVTPEARLGALEMLLVTVLAEKKADYIERLRALHTRIMDRLPPGAAEIADYVDYLLARAEAVQRRRRPAT
jgi:hypothetical protein